MQMKLAIPDMFLDEVFNMRNNGKMKNAIDNDYKFITKNDSMD